jgi:hypothetical protein
MIPWLDIMEDRVGLVNWTFNYFLGNYEGIGYVFRSVPV